MPSITPRPGTLPRDLEPPAGCERSREGAIHLAPGVPAELTEAELDWIRRAHPSVLAEADVVGRPAATSTNLIISPAPAQEAGGPPQETVAEVEMAPPEAVVDYEPAASQAPPPTPVPPAPRRRGGR
jgi:hypothetical protein